MLESSLPRLCRLGFRVILPSTTRFSYIPQSHPEHPRIAVIERGVEVTLRCLRVFD